ncbi:hypothetical protein Cni_G19774 [Canna indica]|uniref:Uncharacterized protein n=1 Tax=Canna indica TaxID=4628 RepID=A0AAQ3KL37_9LILI|nr:hypothetical protein Cni_G19774 [Canna indica]
MRGELGAWETKWLLCLLEEDQVVGQDWKRELGAGFGEAQEMGQARGGLDKQIQRRQIGRSGKGFERRPRQADPEQQRMNKRILDHES